MSTFMTNKGSIVRKWYILDAAGKPLGKTAAAAATLLRGKHKPEFTPHADCGDFVVIVNAQKAVLTGKKLEQKYYRRHSGWIGGLKETKYRLLMQQKPELAMQLAVAACAQTSLVRILCPACTSTAAPSIPTPPRSPKPGPPSKQEVQRNV